MVKLTGENNEFEVKTINMRPTWENLMSGIIDGIRNGDFDTQKLMEEELFKLARFVDAVNDKNQPKA